MTWRAKLGVGAIVVAAVLAYAHDPPWAGRVTSGMRAWEEDPPGTRFRWTSGRASFFIPSDAAVMTLPLRAVFAGPRGQPTRVEVDVDGRWLTTLALPDPAAWVRATLPVGRRPTHRRFRRIDLRINRVVGPFVLGVMTGEIETSAAATAVP